MKLSANQAAKEAGIAKKTLLEALKTGRLSAEKDDKGHWQIDPAELFRVFPKTSDDQLPEPQPTPSTETENRLEIARLRAALEGAERLSDSLADQVADLRARLDQEGEERRALTARLLTDQRPVEAAPTPKPIAAPVYEPSAEERASWVARIGRAMMGRKVNT